MSRVLTINDACTIADIVRCVQGCQPITRLLDGGDVVTGTARSIGDEHGNFLARGDDVRDGFLRVTTSMGFEEFWEMAMVMDEVECGTIALNYRAEG